MKASELITVLEDLIAEHGDHGVFGYWEEIEDNGPLNSVHYQREAFWLWGPTP